MSPAERGCAPPVWELLADRPNVHPLHPLDDVDEVDEPDDGSREAVHPPGRVPPHNLDAERSLLGAMLLSHRAIADAWATITAGDLYKPAHSQIFQAIVDSRRADPVVRRHQLDQIGGPGTLASLQAGCPSTTSARRYARIVAEHATLRRLIGVAGDIAELGYGTPEDVPAALARARDLVDAVATEWARRA
jgi:replicative DNA helicase